MSELPELETMEALVQELQLGSARGGRKLGPPVAVESIRSLVEEDLEELANPSSVGAVASIPQIRHQHHQIAGYLARGLPNHEISAITGFNPSYISILKNAPDMKQLIEYYQQQAEERTVDALARLRSLGIASVEELQNRMNEAPEKFTVAQLTELISVGILQTSPAGGRGPQMPGGGGVQISLHFQSPAESLGEPGGVILEGTARKAAG